MPELPDIALYVEALDQRIRGRKLLTVRRKSPFLLRTAIPPISECEGRHVEGVDRLGKRIAIGLEGDRWLVLHLMIAGRLHWSDTPASLTLRHNLAAFDFETGSLRLDEPGSKKRASLHVVAGRAALEQMRPLGIEPLDVSRSSFGSVLRLERRTLKRFLTDQRLVAGIGNAYSDEILHQAKLSPISMTSILDDSEVERLYQAMRAVLSLWSDRLRDQAAGRFPEKVTAFRPEMAVHGLYGKPCPVCATSIQRIRHVSNETNYCPRCQTGGKLLADRALSRVLKSDWPKNIEDLEARIRDLSKPK